MSATEQLPDTIPPSRLCGWLMVSAGGGALLGCQPASYLTIREKVLTVTVYLLGKLVSLAILAVRIGHGREIAMRFVMDGATFVATICLFHGLRLDKALKPLVSKHPSARIGFT